MFDLNDPKNVSHVRKLYYKRFAWKVEKMGLDPEDVLQDIYTTILYRNDPNSGCTPYDPARGCVSNYLFKVIVSVVYHTRRIKFHTKKGVALATALPLHLEGEGGEIYDAPWLPSQDPGGGGDVWAHAAEQAGLSVDVLLECADGRDLEKEAREAERLRKRQAAEEARAARVDARWAEEASRAARAALAAMTPAERKERDRAWKKAYQAVYYQRKKEEAAAAKKGKTPSQD